MLTAPQLRAARALLGLTIDEASDLSGLAPDAIRKAEASEHHGLPEVSERLRAILESRGVVFLSEGEGSGGIGVRLRQTAHDEGIRPQNLNSANDG